MSETDGMELAIRVAMMPRDTNVHGTIFGGVILSHIDQAGAVVCRGVTPGKVVTVAMKEVEFHQPVFCGDVVSYYAKVLRTGRTSITTMVKVEAERISQKGLRVPVTSAEVVYVGVDDTGRKVLLPGRNTDGEA